MQQPESIRENDTQKKSFDIQTNHRTLCPLVDFVVPADSQVKSKERQNRDKYLDPNRLISLVGRVFANGPGELGLIPGHVIPITLKMVLNTSLLNAQQYKVRIKSKEEQSWERRSAVLYTSV